MPQRVVVVIILISCIHVAPRRLDPYDTDVCSIVDESRIER